MSLLRKYCLLLCVCLSIYTTGSAGVIDSLKSKADVQNFIAKNFRESPIAYLNDFANIFHPKARLDYPAYIDTFEVYDPVKDEMVINTVPRDARSVDVLSDDDALFNTYSNTEFIRLVYASPYNIYKADIDNNELTDLVLDVERVGFFVIIDHGNKQEVHLLSDSPNFSLYSFNSFISLPDGSKGLSLERSPCDKKHEHTTDTIVYKFNNFMKYNKQYKPVGISKIRYQYRLGYGTVSDGIRCIEINKNCACYTSCSKHNKTFSATIDNVNLTYLWNSIAYVNIHTTKGRQAPVTSSTGCVFTIYYDDGTKFTILYWGFKPSMGTAYLSKSISDISTLLNWELTAENVDIGCLHYFPIDETYSISDEYPGDCDWTD